MASIWNAQYWRAKAKHARQVANEMRNLDAKRTMLEVAKSYDKFAAQVAEREAGQKGDSTVAPHQGHR